MKKLCYITVSLLLVLCLFCPTTVLADTGGSGNIDGGGGGMGSGTSSNYWNPGNEGVRVTVVRASDHAVVTTPVDFTNISPTNVRLHFGSACKISYTSGKTLTPSGTSYTFVNPGQTMPRIISTDGTTNIDAIKKYFCSEYVVKRIAEVTGMNYDVLIGGDYKILLEPIAYYTFQGVMIATTATEAALYDRQVNGLLRSWMQSLTHKNLPLELLHPRCISIRFSPYKSCTESHSFSASR